MARAAAAEGGWPGRSKLLEAAACDGGVGLSHCQCNTHSRGWSRVVVLAQSGSSKQQVACSGEAGLSRLAPRQNRLLLRMKGSEAGLIRAAATAAAEERRCTRLQWWRGSAQAGSGVGCGLPPRLGLGTGRQTMVTHMVKVVFDPGPALPSVPLSSPLDTRFSPSFPLSLHSSVPHSFFPFLCFPGFLLHPSLPRSLSLCFYGFLLHPPPLPLHPSLSQRSLAPPPYLPLYLCVSLPRSLSSLSLCWSGCAVCCLSGSASGAVGFLLLCSFCASCVASYACLPALGSTMCFSGFLFHPTLLECREKKAQGGQASPLMRV